MPPLFPDIGLGEWLDRQEPYDAGHRHRSHLVGILPGDRITVEDTPADAAGVRQALAYRHSHGSGSSLSFSTVSDAMIYARLYDAEAALRQIDLTFYHNVMDNLLMALCDWRSRGDTLAWFGGRKCFQIEAGLGLSCAIAELVVQDRRGVIRLLPALPQSWPAGQVRGICARAGFEVSLSWAAGRLADAQIFSRLGGPCRVMVFSAGEACAVLCDGQPVAAEYRDNILHFATEAGRTYGLQPAGQEKPA
jgi:alpha-L-fucosidase 2